MFSSITNLIDNSSKVTSSPDNSICFNGVGTGIVPKEIPGRVAA